MVSRLQAMMILVLFGLVSCLACVAAADLLNPQWSWMEEMASHFVNGRAGWLITVALLSISFASALLTWWAARARPRNVGGVWALGIWTGGVLLAAAFPADPPGQWDQPLSTAATIHGLAGNVAFVALVVAAILLTWSWRHGRLGPILSVTAAAVVLAFVGFAVTLVDVFDGPSLTFGGYVKIVGLTERLMLVADVVWLATVAVRLRRLPVRAA